MDRKFQRFKSLSTLVVISFLLLSVTMAKGCGRPPASDGRPAAGEPAAAGAGGSPGALPGGPGSGSGGSEAGGGSGAAGRGSASPPPGSPGSSPDPVPGATPGANPGSGQNPGQPAPGAGILLGVSLGNSPPERPQEGLELAGLVYEFPVEGGITRLMALFKGAYPETVGPVRSVRPYFLERVLESGAVIAHAGGSPEAWAMISEFGIPTLDDIKGAPGFFRSPLRKAPYNLYARTQTLLESALRRGWGRASAPYAGFAAVPQGEAGGVSGEARTVSIRFHKNNLVAFGFDPGKPAYTRRVGGGIHLSTAGDEITVANILVQRVGGKVIDKEGRLRLETVGQGETLAFQGGKFRRGTWKKRGIRDTTIYYDSDGKLLTLLPGTTWILLVPPWAEVSWS